MLVLNHTQIADAGREHLKGLPKLLGLYLDDSQLSPLGANVRDRDEVEGAEPSSEKSCFDL